MENGYKTLAENSILYQSMVECGLIDDEKSIQTNFSLNNEVQNSTENYSTIDQFDETNVEGLEASGNSMIYNTMIECGLIDDENHLNCNSDTIVNDKQNADTFIFESDGNDIVHVLFDWVLETENNPELQNCDLNQSNITIGSNDNNQEKCFLDASNENLDPEGNFQLKCSRKKKITKKNNNSCETITAKAIGRCRARTLLKFYSAKAFCLAYKISNYKTENGRPIYT